VYRRSNLSDIAADLRVIGRHPNLKEIAEDQDYPTRNNSHLQNLHQPMNGFGVIAADCIVFQLHQNPKVWANAIAKTRVMKAA